MNCQQLSRFHSKALQWISVQLRESVFFHVLHIFYWWHTCVKLSNTTDDLNLSSVSLLCSADNFSNLQESKDISYPNLRKSYLLIFCFWAANEITVVIQLNVSLTRLVILFCSFVSSSIVFANHWIISFFFLMSVSVICFRLAYRFQSLTLLYSIRDMIRRGIARHMNSVTSHWM